MRSSEAPFLRMAHDIAFSHHEKFDGSGHPQGLFGDVIPLAARIVAVANVYAALTTHRVYNDAYSHEKSESIIVEGGGNHFDPDVVDGFWQITETFQAIRQHFDDDRYDAIPNAVAKNVVAPVFDSSDYLGTVERASVV